MNIEWETSDRFIDSSNKMMARILSVVDGTVAMERWPVKGGRRIRFTLSVAFFVSPSCGWRPIDKSTRSS